MAQKGGISVQTQHIFPIIKRWLYSDKEIFLREQVCNASDAITKLQRLASLGKWDGADGWEPRIDVSFDKDEGTLSISDNGIGMTAEEIQKYITQIALSGALEFIEKYETVEGAEASETSPSQSGAAKNGIIGHFGLGFYSAFMVADSVEIRSLSFEPGAKPAYWVCGEDGDFELSEGDECEPDQRRAGHGTDVILHITQDERELLERYKLSSILEKYCAFMPHPIYLEDDDKGEDEHDHEHEGHDEEDAADKPINDTKPLWMRSPSECVEEQYTEFYQKVFHDFKKPLFYIHINADYPLNFKGILYFTKIGHEYETLEGEVKLYYNQVFVADNIKEVIPEYLLMLKGVIDCPELPLNVSRSYLQNNGYVSKISAHISKKVADKLNSLFNTERERYEGFWPDIKTVVQYGCIRDHKFFERMRDSIIYQRTDDKYVTLAEYLAAAESRGRGRRTVYYANDAVQQAMYIKLFRDRGFDVLLLDRAIENSFIHLIEMENPPKDGVEALQFKRVDADVDALSDGAGSGGDVAANMKEAFEAATGALGLKCPALRIAPMSGTEAPALLHLDEQARRMADMMRLYRMQDPNIPEPPVSDEKLDINTSSAAVKKLTALCDAGDKPSAVDLAGHIYLLAALSQRQLSAKELEQLMAQSYRMLGE